VLQIGSHLQLPGFPGGFFAGKMPLAAYLICNQGVAGSIPVSGS